MNYGGYSAPSEVTPDVQQWFNTVDVDRSGKIDAKKLQAALVTGNGKNFSDTACRLMIKMFDKDNSGNIEVQEFQQLFSYINNWISTFRTYDRDESGSIEETEFNTAMQQMGFRFSDDFVRFILEKNDPVNKRAINVDQFIVFCVQLQRATEKFRSKDTQQQGSISINYEDCLDAVLSTLP